MKEINNERMKERENVYIELTYDYSMAKHQNVIECSVTGKHQKQLR